MTILTGQDLYDAVVKAGYKSMIAGTTLPTLSTPAGTRIDTDKYQILSVGEYYEHPTDFFVPGPGKILPTSGGTYGQYTVTSSTSLILRRKAIVTYDDLMEMATIAGYKPSYFTSSPSALPCGKIDLLKSRVMTVGETVHAGKDVYFDGHVLALSVGHSPVGPGFSIHFRERHGASGATGATGVLSGQRLIDEAKRLGYDVSYGYNPVSYSPYWIAVRDGISVDLLKYELAPVGAVPDSAAEYLSSTTPEAWHPWHHTPTRVSNASCLVRQPRKTPPGVLVTQANADALLSTSMSPNSAITDPPAKPALPKCPRGHAYDVKPCKTCMFLWGYMPDN